MDAELVKIYLGEIYYYSLAYLATLRGWTSFGPAQLSYESRLNIACPPDYLAPVELELTPFLHKRFSICSIQCVKRSCHLIQNYSKINA